MKIIFLKVDGVLNSTSTKETCEGLTGIDSSKVKLLKKIVDATGAQIVLSSTWRDGWAANGKYTEDWHGNMLHYLFDKLDEENITVFSRTPFSDPVHPHRGKEIKKWLDGQKKEPIDNYIIIDDDTFDIVDTNLHKGHVIETSYKRGLRSGAVNMAIQMLNKGE